jgi:pyridoxal biosynthesis lyase PdxS
MHEIRVSIVSPEAADHGVAELWTADELIGYTILADSDLMVHIEPRRDRSPVVVGARSLAHALSRAEHLLERY